MPFAGALSLPSTLMLVKLRPAEPMAVLATLSAGAGAVVMVLPRAFDGDRAAAGGAKAGAAGGVDVEAAAGEGDRVAGLERA